MYMKIDSHKIIFFRINNCYQTTTLEKKSSQYRKIVRKNELYKYINFCFFNQRLSFSTESFKPTSSKPFLVQISVD